MPPSPNQQSLARDLTNRVTPHRLSLPNAVDAARLGLSLLCAVMGMLSTREEQFGVAMFAAKGQVVGWAEAVRWEVGSCQWRWLIFV